MTAQGETNLLCKRKQDDSKQQKNKERNQYEPILERGKLFILRQQIQSMKSLLKCGTLNKRENVVVRRDTKTKLNEANLQHFIFDFQLVECNQFLFTQNILCRECLSERLKHWCCFWIMHSPLHTEKRKRKEKRCIHHSAKRRKAKSPKKVYLKRICMELRLSQRRSITKRSEERHKRR